MRKAEAIERVAADARLSRPDAARAVDALLRLIEQQLRAGDEVAFSGFGKFHVGRRRGRAAANPRTGERIIVADVAVARFTPGAALKRAVRG
jgi:DNA-binding protein HU-beta